MFVYIGPTPGFSGCIPNIWLDTGNLMDSLEARFDLSQLGGPWYGTSAELKSLFGSETITGIQLVVDSGWLFDTQTILVDNSTINAKTYDFEPCISVDTTKGLLSATVVPGSGETVTGEVNAMGCDIGVYVGTDISDVIISASIHDANKFGVLSDGEADVNSGTIFNIGNHNGALFEPNGVQTGIGIYFTEGSNGDITNNQVYNYQKGGVVVKGSDYNGRITNNTVTGLGLIDFIAQNGIQMSSGAVVSELKNNTVTGNAYMTGKNMALGNGPWVSCGLLFYQSGMTKSEQGSSMSRNIIKQNRANLCNF